LGTKLHQQTSFFGKLVKILIIAVIVAIILKAFFIDAYKIPTGSMENTLLIGDFIIVNKLAYSVTTPRNVPLTDIYLKPYRLIKLSKPEKNDVIVFEYPGNKHEFSPAARVNYIKRVAGGPGDTVQIKDKDVYINKELQQYPSTIKTNNTLRKNRYKDPAMFYSGEPWNTDYYGPLVIPGKGSVVSLNLKNIETWGMIINREYGRKVVSVEGTVITIEGNPVKEYTFQKDYYFVLGDNRDDSMDSRYWGFVPEDNIIGEALLIYWSWNPTVSEFDPMNMFNSIRLERIFTFIE